MVLAALQPRFDVRQPPKGTYSAIIYVSGSKIFSEDCNGQPITSGIAGTNDVAVIQATVDHFATSGAVIRFGEGFYTIDSAIELKYNHPFTLIGAGRGTNGSWGLTHFVQSANCNMIESLPTSPTRWFDRAIEGIDFQNTASWAGKAIYATGINRLRINDCSFQYITEAIDIREVYTGEISACNFYSNGDIATTKATLHLGSLDVGNFDLQIFGNNFQNDRYRAIESVGLTNESNIYHNYIEGSDFEGNHCPTDSSIYGEFQKCNIYGNLITSSMGGVYTGIGIHTIKYRVNIFDNTIAASSIAIKCDDSYANIHHNQIYDYGLNGIHYAPDVVGSVPWFGSICDNVVRNISDVHATGAGIYARMDHTIIARNLLIDCHGNAIELDDAQYCIVEGNKVLKAQYDVTTGGVIEIGTSDYNRVIQNSLETIAVPVVFLGSHSTAKRNGGYVTENSGTSTGEDVSQTLPHGLRKHPTMISIVPNTSGTSVSELYAVTTHGIHVSDASPSTDISAGTDTSFNIQVDGGPVRLVSLTVAGLNTGALIAAAMQTAIRALGSECQLVTVVYTTVYTITSPSVGASSTIRVTNATSNNVADDLHIGTVNSGVNTDGIGNLYPNVTTAKTYTWSAAVI